ncbi:acylphosphatase [Nonomuraea sp. NPDC051941]|uniref:acylphosphatase n=1 Tax=Nonomuraea sp. NPDC051941 TaxID=3364373 RepID=UPI0037C6A730
MMDPARRIEVHRTVHGVGFRPFVQRLVTGMGTHEHIGNAGGHIVISARGPPVQQEELLRLADPAAQGSLPTGATATSS